MTYALIIALFGTVVIMALNMASRRKAAKDLRNQFRFLQTLMNSVPSPVFYKDKDGIYLGCNTAFFKMLGREMNDVVGKTVYDLSPKDLAEVYEKADNDLFERGGVQRYETQVKFADGSIHEMFFTKAVFHNDDGEVAGLLGVMIDITARKNAEEKLKEAHSVLEQKVDERTRELNQTNARLEQAEKESRTQKEFLETVINAIDHGIVVVDAEDHTVKLANRAVSEGNSYEGVHCYELLHRRTSQCIEDVDVCPLHAVKESGKPLISEHEHLGGDGQIQYVEIHTFPVFDDSGEVTQVINSILDVSERRRAEKATIEAKEMAEATSRLMAEFLDTASHEMRTPMTSVHGFAKLALKSFNRGFAKCVEDDPILEKTANRVKDNLKIIISESERMTTLINDQLDLSKLQSGRIDWKEAELAPVDLLKKTQAATSSFFAKSSVRFEIEHDPDLPTLLADSDRLLQVMLNLVSNAVKFTEEGTVICKASSGEGFVTFSVSDSGIGIPQAQQKDIFNKFIQVNSTVKGKPTGTGLGLAISKKIVEHHKGTIWVESELGKGSTFYFTIPIHSS